MNAYVIPGIKMQVTASQLILMICEKVGVDRESLNSPCRIPNNVLARQLSYYFMIDKYGINPQVAAYHFKQDRTTAIHAYQKMQDLLSVHDEIATTNVDHFRNILNI